MKVVLHQPLRQVRIEALAVGREIAQLYEFLPEGPVKAFINRIVRRGLGSGEVVRQMKDGRSGLKILGKLRSIVSLNVFDLSGKQVVQASQKISGMTGMLGGIHAGKCNLGIHVNSGKDVALHTIAVYGQTVKRYQKAIALFFLELGDALLWLINFPLLAQPFSFLGMVVKTMFLNDPLNLPGRDLLAIRFPVQNRELLLTVADVLSSERRDAEFLHARYLPFTYSVRSARMFLQRFKTPGIIAFLPLMERLSRDAEVTACLGDILYPMIVVHPCKAHTCLTRQHRSRMGWSNSFGEDVCGIHTSPIVLTQTIPARHR